MSFYYHVMQQLIWTYSYHTRQIRVKQIKKSQNKTQNRTKLRISCESLKTMQNEKANTEIHIYQKKKKKKRKEKEEWENDKHRIQESNSLEGKQGKYGLRHLEDSKVTWISIFF